MATSATDALAAELTDAFDSLDSLVRLDSVTSEPASDEDTARTLYDELGLRFPRHAGKVAARGEREGEAEDVSVHTELGLESDLPP